MKDFYIFKVELDRSTLIETYSRREAVDRFTRARQTKAKSQILRLLINNSPSIVLGPEGGS